MSTPINIKDSTSGKLACLVDRSDSVGLVTYSDPLTEFEQYTTLAVNPTLGFEMNQDAAFTGTPDLVNNGGDTVAWTGSNITGSKVTFNSTAQAHTGSASVLVNNPALNNIWQFDKGSTFTPANYIALTLWVYVDSNWTAGDSVSIYGWDVSGGSQVGVSVNLEDYINEVSFGVWQKATIPIEDFVFAGGTFDGLRMELIGKNGPAPIFYIDDMQFEESGGLAVFKIAPRSGEVFFVERFTLTFIDAYDSTLLNSSMPNLSYDKILGELKLSNGIIINRVQGGITEFAGVLSCLGDATRGGATIGDLYGDGTNTTLSLNIDFSEPVRLDDKDGDNLNLTISDNLSGFISFTTLARGKILKRT